MKTERELFEGWFKSTKWFTGDNCTPKYRTYRSMLQAWQAATQRDGFKLVPVEPTQEMMQAVVDEVKNTGGLACFYKAMIGVCDDN